MDNTHFDAGIRHLEIMFAEALEGERRKQYFRHLQKIPNDLWDAGIVRITEQVRFSRFPLVAEIGEACVPGVAETEDLDPWTRRWTKTLTPWPVRLATLVQPALAPPTPQLQIPGPRDPLSDAERVLFPQLSREEEIKKYHEDNARRARQREEEVAGGSPYAHGHVRDLVNINSREAKAVAAYWTPERTEARREELHRQTEWISRRTAAEQSGQQFIEPPPPPGDRLKEP